MKNRERNFYKNTIIIFASKFCTQFLSFFLLPLFTSLLSTKQYGYFDLFSTYSWLLAIFLTLQLENGMFRYMIDKRNNAEGLKEIITSGLLMIGIQFLLFTVLYFFFVKIFHVNNVGYIFAMTVSTSLLNLTLQIARGFGKNIDYSMASIIAGVSNVLLCILFIKILSLKLLGIVLANVLSNLGAAIYLILKMKLFSYLDLNFISKKYIKKILAYSLPLVPNSISSWIMSISDKAMISMFLGVSFNGIYSISTKFSILLSHIFTVFNISWTESASLSNNDKDRSYYFSKMVNSIFLICSFICLIMLSSLPIVFNLLIKGNYSSAYNYIPILILSSFFELFSVLIGGIFIALKLSKEIATTTMVGGVVNIVVNFIFLRKYGLVVACVSTLLSYIYISIARYFKISKHIKVELDKTKYLIIIILYILSTGIYFKKSIYLSFINIIIVFGIFFKMNATYIKKIMYSFFIKKN